MHFLVRHAHPHLSAFAVNGEPRIGPGFLQAASAVARTNSSNAHVPPESAQEFHFYRVRPRSNGSVHYSVSSVVIVNDVSWNGNPIRVGHRDIPRVTPRHTRLVAPIASSNDKTLRAIASSSLLRPTASHVPWGMSVTQGTHSGHQARKPDSSARRSQRKTQSAARSNLRSCNAYKQHTGPPQT
jgi:hypothetical protein